MCASQWGRIRWKQKYWWKNQSEWKNPFGKGSLWNAEKTKIGSGISLNLLLKITWKRNPRNNPPSNSNPLRQKTFQNIYPGDAIFTLTTKLKTKNPNHAKTESIDQIFNKDEFYRHCMYCNAIYDNDWKKKLLSAGPCGLTGSIK